ncbi:MAG: hypothetical protein HKN98_09720 [Silicimonas sp.]|nr:hypothetical protein [Silicimonas sp.]
MTTLDDWPGVVERTVENLVSVVGSFLPSLGARKLHGGLADALIGFGVYLTVASVGYLALFAYTPLDYEAMRGFAGTATLGIAIAVVMLSLLRTHEDWAGLAVGLLWAMALGTCLATVTYLYADVRTLGDWILFGVLPSLVPAAVLLLARLGPLKGVLVTLAFALPTLGGSLDEILRSWGFGTSEDTAEYVPPDTEMIYALQRDLLDGQANLRPGDPDRVEMFAVLGAGDPYQSVFSREVRAVGAFLEREMDGAGRVLRLINDDGAPTAYPLMNRVNLRRALADVRGAMDDDDLLFLFLTSHGGPGLLSARFDPVITRDIRPEDIADALDEADIGNAIIVISACYSGSFTDALAAPDRLILTAASADRTSFGCSDTAVWTEWGRAFFVESWPQNRDPRVAAVRAQEIVAKRETQRGLETSSPLIVEGDEIGAVIDRWLETLD